MTAAVGFWLNLDAELELERPKEYRQSPRVAARVDALRPRLSHLLGVHGRVIGRDDVPASSRTLAWCPTPSALDAITARGLAAPAHPPLEVLRRVNHRGFCASLGQTLEGATLVDTMDALEAIVRKPTPTGDWVLKRPFGFAGRERRRAIGGVLDASTEGFARITFERGDVLQVEPWLTRELDVSIHGFVLPSGKSQLANAVVQHCDAMGRFERAGEDARHALDDTHHAALADEAERVAAALHHAGYFGPFGVDAFCYRDHDGALAFNPRSEINARFTMGYRWPPGIGPSEASSLLI